MLREITFRFILYTVVLLSFALVPAEQGWRTGKQFFAVPGGLVVRKSGWLKKGWRIKLFSRTASCVMICPIGRKQWLLTVSDGETCESVIGLRSELELALCAWLSPLEPPKLEQLSDLS